MIKDTEHDKFNPQWAIELTVAWLQRWFHENGEGRKAVIGMSGGKDSTIAAALCAMALGADNVVGVLMPNGFQPDIEDAYTACARLDIKPIKINIFPMYKAARDAIQPELNGEWSEQTNVNLPARLRMATLYAVSQTIGGRVINTCNYSEDYVGYSTRYGDAAGDVSPLGKFTVQEVIEIGHSIKAIEDLVDKAPSDGLCGKTDEDNLGFTYKTLDDYIRYGIEPEPQVKSKIDDMHAKNEFKLKPIPIYDYYSDIAKWGQ